MGRKHCGKRKKLHVTSNFSFSTVFSKDFYCRHVKTRACLRKGLSMEYRINPRVTKRETVTVVDTIDSDQIAKTVQYDFGSTLFYTVFLFLPIAPPGWLSGERVGLMTWWLWVRSPVEATFLSGVFSLLTSAEACEKSSR